MRNIKGWNSSFVYAEIPLLHTYLLYIKSEQNWLDANQEAKKQVPDW